MIVKTIKRILATLMIIFCVFQISEKSNFVNAMEIGEKVYLQRGEKGFLSIQRWNGSQWMYIIHSITKYKDEEGIERIAYCVSPDLNGIGYIEGEYEGDDVEAKDFLSDEKLWRVYSNGYPYKSPEEMGVEYDEDAYLATKQAGFCVIRGYSIDYIRENFRAGQDPVAGESFDLASGRAQTLLAPGPISALLP